MLTNGILRVLRGQVSFGRAALESFRRGRVKVQSRRERTMLDDLAVRPAGLRPEFQNLSSAELLKHFQSRVRPSFLPGFEHIDSTASQQRDLLPAQTAQLIKSARTIQREHRWRLLGFGEHEFGTPINWHRDPLSGRIWPRDYHADIPLWHNDGSDIRVLWELNRLGHLITLGRAHALTKEEDFAAEFFAQLESWRDQNPVGRGANWMSAMEVALRAMNLLAAFSLFHNSIHLNADRLLLLLATFEQHGAHVRRNLEFSHIATSNHYLANVAGLLWLGIMLPELAIAEEWRSWALNEFLCELDKQILPDGADYEGSTGYHRFVLELVLYSFVLCRTNDIEIADKYWRTLHTMLEYVRAYLRPDALAPLIGDSDGGQVLPIIAHAANDHAYLLNLGAVVFNDAQFKVAHTESTEHLLWMLGETGVKDYDLLGGPNQLQPSKAFPAAGIYVLRNDDLFLLFNANGSRTGRPTSHQHNDLLSVEVSAGGRAFIVDPGTYVYTADLHERHRFRSTAYHSTIEIDDQEQRTIYKEAPFGTVGNASVRVLAWESTPEHDCVVAEHTGYERLAEPLTHRRSIIFDKANRYWLIEDELRGIGQQKIVARFHFDADLAVKLFADNSVLSRDAASGASLLVHSLDLQEPADLQAQFTSRHYGSKAESVTACWVTNASVPYKVRWAIIAVSADEDVNERLRVLKS
jgi:hypothetical protein